MEICELAFYDWICLSLRKRSRDARSTAGSNFCFAVKLPYASRIERNNEVEVALSEEKNAVLWEATMVPKT